MKMSEISFCFYGFIMFVIGAYGATLIEFVSNLGVVLFAILFGLIIAVVTHIFVQVGNKNGNKN